MTDIHDVLARLQELADEAFALAGSIEDAAARGLKAHRSVSELWGVEPLVRAAVGAFDSRVQGAGFVTAIGLLDPERWWLEWFVREEDSRVGRLEIQRDPTAIGFHDYQLSPWYAVPRTTGERHITGPYVDNLCTDDYTLTFTQPLVVDGEFLGVSGADIGVRTAERELLPVLRAVRQRAAVVNTDGRVLVSNSGELLCGDLVDPEAPISERVQLPGLPLAVVALR